MKKIIILLSIFSLSSCSLLNNASTNTEENNRKYSAQKSIRSINKKANSIKYIQAKAKVSFRDNKKMKSNTVTFRISSGEKLWINAALGAARILIDNDSIKYYNKIEKNFFATDFSYLNDKIGVEANFEILENFLLGMLIEKFSPSSLFKKLKDRYIFKENQFILDSKSVESTVTISSYNFTIFKQTFATDENLFEVIYDDYVKVDDQNFPTKIRFINNGLENFNIEIKSISALDKINIPFRIPKNYKRIGLE
tara:strand:+ start:520 stop:1278 length:759 start_codon:yes stop_codon:yes gene_type:complete